jgi:hypothetical protein
MRYLRTLCGSRLSHSSQCSSGRQNTPVFFVAVLSTYRLFYISLNDNAPITEVTQLKFFLLDLSFSQWNAQQIFSVVWKFCSNVHGSKLHTGRYFVASYMMTGSGGLGFSHLDTGIVSSNPTGCMDVFLCVSVLCCPVQVEYFATGWSLAQLCPTRCLKILRNLRCSVAKVLQAL